jgi:hypothetical protein
VRPSDLLVIICRCSSPTLAVARPTLESPPLGSKSKPSKEQAATTDFCGLLFDCEDRGDIFFQDIDFYQTAHCYNPEDYTICCHYDNQEGEEGMIFK